MANQKKLQWWKMWADFLDDDKVAELNDFECRLFVMAMAFCCRSPYEKWRRGALAITNTMPVTAQHFARRLHRSPARIERALLRICQVGAPDSPLLRQEDGFWVLPGWGYRQERDDDIPRGVPAITPAITPQDSHAKPAPEVEVEVEVEEEKDTAPPRPSWPAERDALKALSGYPLDEKKDSALMASLAEAYSQLDLAKEVRKLKAWAQAQGILPLTGQRGPRQRVRRWMKKADEMGVGQSRGGGSDRVRRHAPATADQFPETGEVKL